MFAHFVKKVQLFEKKFDITPAYGPLCAHITALYPLLRPQWLAQPAMASSAGLGPDSITTGGAPQLAASRRAVKRLVSASKMFKGRRAL